jgi:hypothetical protein
MRDSVGKSPSKCSPVQVLDRVYGGKEAGLAGTAGETARSKSTAGAEVFNFTYSAASRF